MSRNVSIACLNHCCYFWLICRATNDGDSTEPVLTPTPATSSSSSSRRNVKSNPSTTTLALKKRPPSNSSGTNNRTLSSHSVAKKSTVNQSNAEKHRIQNNHLNRSNSLGTHHSQTNNRAKQAVRFSSALSADPETTGPELQAESKFVSLDLTNEGAPTAEDSSGLPAKYLAGKLTYCIRHL